jgi:hypothetical protein
MKMWTAKMVPVSVTLAALVLVFAAVGAEQAAEVAANGIGSLSFAMVGGSRSLRAARNLQSQQKETRPEERSAVNTV